jgi:hypothetical protein
MPLLTIIPPPTRLPSSEAKLVSAQPFRVHPWAGQYSRKWLEVGGQGDSSHTKWLQRTSLEIVLQTRSDWLQEIERCTQNAGRSLVQKGNCYMKSFICTYFSRYRHRFESRQGKVFLFCTLSRPALGLTQPPITKGRAGNFPGEKRPKREANHSPSSSYKVKNGWAMSPLPPYDSA